MQICEVLKHICIRMYDLVHYHDLKLGVVLELCHIEFKYFLPIFKILMTHPTLHLIDKLDINGLVCFYWMYPIEQTLKDFEGYVQNMCKLKDNMAKGYIFDEVSGLRIKYMKIFVATRRQVWNVNEDEWIIGEVLGSAPKPQTLNIQLIHVGCCTLIHVWKP